VHQNIKEALMSDLRQRVRYTVMFLRVAGGEMRKLAEDTPEIARELLQIAEQLHGEAEGLTKRLSE
jgi:hypothetical protein